MATKTQRLFPAYALWVIRWRWLVVFASLLIIAAAAFGVRQLGFTADYRVYFGEDNPDLNAFESLEATYTKTDNILFVVQPEKGSVFTRDMLTIMARLTDAAWNIPYSVRVDSLTNFQNTEAKGDDVIVADLVETPEALTEADLAKIREVALNEPSLVNLLVSADERTTGVSVTLRFPGADHTEHLPRSVAFAEGIKRDFLATYPGLTVAVTGLAVLSDAEIQVVLADMRTLTPAMYGVIVLLLILLLRSVSGTIATLLIVSMSAAAAAGLMGYLGIKLNASTAMAPIIILTLAVADCVHILLSVRSEMRDGSSKHDALVEALRINARPVFLTSLTTAIGFLSLNFSESPPFRELGNVAAIGLAVAWALSMTFLPALMALLPLRVKPRAAGERAPMDRFGDFVVAKRRPLLWSMSALTLAAVAFIPSMKIDDRFVKWFDESLPFRVDTDFASDNLIGPYTLDFSIGSGEAGGISNPAYLETLDAFATWLRGQPDVIHVSSLTDVMKRLNRTMHGDDPDWYRLPESRDLAAQYLLLYELSLPYGLDLTSQLSLDKAASRVTVAIATVPSRRIRELARLSEAWLAANAPEAMRSKASGLSLIFAYFADRNIRGMLAGTTLAYLLIAGVLMVALRSVRLGLVSLASNGLPVLVTFGLWAMIVGEMGIIASIIAATSLGLIVDDTVYILTKYDRAKREHRLSTHDAVRFAFSRVGTALWVTTLVLVAGFLVLALSEFQLNVRFGILTSTTLVVALALDFLFLPPLLMLIDREPRCDCTTCARRDLRKAEAAASG